MGEVLCPLQNRSGREPKSDPSEAASIDASSCSSAKRLPVTIAKPKLFLACKAEHFLKAASSWPLTLPKTNLCLLVLENRAE